MMGDELLSKLSAQVLRCKQCSTDYPMTREDRTCPHDGGKLVVADSDRVIGSVIAERYVVESLLGLGGWSSVYLAQDRQLQRPVAIKILHYHLRRDDISLKRFQRESLLAASLNHPHITTMFDFGVLANGQPFIVMEYLEGSTVEIIVGFEGQLSSERTVNAICQLCDAFEHAHKKELIHRDIKPSNILFLDSGFVKVMDFGLAKCLDGMHSLTETGQTVGTPTYMSPEQCRGETADARSDIYCLGLVGLFMLTGRHAVSAEGNFEVMHSQLLKNPRTPSEVRPDLYFPPALEEILLRCVKKNPVDRFQNCLELKTALQAASVSKNGAPLSDSSLQQRLSVLGKPALCATVLVCIATVAVAWSLKTAQFKPNVGEGHAPSRLVKAKVGEGHAPSRLVKAKVGDGHAPSRLVKSNVGEGLDRSACTAGCAANGPQSAPSRLHLPEHSVVVGTLPKYPEKEKTEEQASAKADFKSGDSAKAKDLYRKQNADRVPSAKNSRAKTALPTVAEATTIWSAVKPGAEDGASLIITNPAKTDTVTPDRRLVPQGPNGFVVSDLASSKETISVLSSISDCAVLQILRSNVDDTVLAYVIERFPSLRKIAIPCAKITNQGLGLIASSNIRIAHLRSTPITDDGLLNLRRAQRLMHLDLTGDRISDAGVRHLSTLPLRILVLSQTAITNNCADSLSRMTTLEALAVAYTHFGDTGVESISRLSHLKEINCGDTQVTDASMRALASMPALSILGLSGTKVTDAGIATLESSPRLTRLDIADTAVTPAVIVSLLRMKNLQMVRLSNPSMQMLESLRNAHIVVANAEDQLYKSGGMNSAPRVMPRD